MSWSNNYVGIPYSPLGRDRAGADCWGLACIIYREVLGINLPECRGAYASVDEHREISALLDQGAHSPAWAPVSDPARAFDIAVFRRGRLATHVGIVIGDGLMIHMQDEDCAKLASYRTGAWGNRLQGHFRHVSMAVERPFQTASEGEQ